MSIELPKERLIVFAGVGGWHLPRLEALRDRKVKAIMHSFLKIREEKNYGERVVSFLQTWPTFKFLDSGVFTFLRATGQLRSRAKEHATTKSKKLTLEEFDEYATDYKEYLKTHLDLWDFVVELDVDNIFGVEVARHYRAQLKVIAGDKLIPVWHRKAGHSGWVDCYNEFPYIGTGSDKPMDPPKYRRLVEEAHANGSIVHGFGGTRVDIMHAVPYDTADSTTWLSSVRYGQFGGIEFRRKMAAGGRASTRAISRARQLETTFSEHGIDRAGILGRKVLKGKFLLAIARLQKREAEFPSVKEAFMQEGLFK